jgi:hypothetical protein
MIGKFIIRVCRSCLHSGAFVCTSWHTQYDHPRNMKRNRDGRYFIHYGTIQQMFEASFECEHTTPTVVYPW